MSGCSGVQAQPTDEEKMDSAGAIQWAAEPEMRGNKDEDVEAEDEAGRASTNAATALNDGHTADGALVEELPLLNDKTEKEVELLVSEHKERINMMVESRNVLNNLILIVSNKYKDAPATDAAKAEYKKEFFTLKRSLHALLRSIKLSDDIVRRYGQLSLVDPEIYVNNYYSKEDMNEYIQDMDNEESMQIAAKLAADKPNANESNRLTYSAFSAAREEAMAINPEVRNLRNIYQEFLTARIEYVKAADIAARENSVNTFSCRDFILERSKQQKSIVFPVQRVAAPKISVLDEKIHNEWTARSAALMAPLGRLLKDSDKYGILNSECLNPPVPYKIRAFHLDDFDRQLQKEDDINQQLPPSVPYTNVTFAAFRPWILSRKLYFKRVLKRRRRYNKLSSSDKMLVKAYTDERIEERLNFIEENYHLPNDDENVDDYDPDKDLIYPAKFLFDLPRPDIYPDPDRPVQQPNALKTSYAYNPTINLWADTKSVVHTSQTSHRIVTGSGFPGHVNSSHSNSYSRNSQGHRPTPQNQNPQVEIFDPYYDPKVPLQIEGFEHMSKVINLVHPGDINILIYEGNRIHHDSVRPAFSYPDTPLPGWSKELMIRMAGASKGYNEISYLPPDRSRRIKNKHELIEFVSRNGITNSIVNKFDFRSCFCVCQKPEDSSSKYLECALGYGGCQGWVHTACVGLGSLSESQIEALPTCICPLCALYLEGTDELKYTNGATILSKMAFPVTPAVTYVNGMSIEESTKPPKIWGITSSLGTAKGSSLNCKNELYEVSHMAQLVVNASIESKEFQKAMGIVPVSHVVAPLNYSNQYPASQLARSVSATAPFTKTQTATEYSTGKGFTQSEQSSAISASVSVHPKKESSSVTQPKVEAKSALPILQHRLFSFIPPIVDDKKTAPTAVVAPEKKSLPTPEKKAVPIPTSAAPAPISEPVSDVEEADENDDSHKAKIKARKFRLTVTGGWMKLNQVDEEGVPAPPHELDKSITKLSMYTASPIAFDMGQLAMDNHNEYGIAHTDLLATDMVDNVANTPYPPNESLAVILPLEDGGLRTTCLSCPQTVKSVHELCTNRIRCAYCYDVITTDAIEITDDGDSVINRSKSKSKKSEASKVNDDDRKSWLLAQHTKKLVEMSFGVVTYQIHPQCAFKLNFDLKKQEDAENETGEKSTAIDKRYSDPNVVNLLNGILNHPHVIFGSFYEYESVDDAECDLCGRSGGIMQFFDLASDCTNLSPPSEVGWLAHTACLYLLTNSSLLSVNVRNEKSIFDQLMSLYRCSICGGSNGLCIRCSAATCTVRAHTLCMIQHQPDWRLTHINQNSDRCLAALCPAHNIK